MPASMACLPSIYMGADPAIPSSRGPDKRAKLPAQEEGQLLPMLPLVMPRASKRDGPSYTLNPKSYRNDMVDETIRLTI